MGVHHKPDVSGRYNMRSWLITSLLGHLFVEAIKVTGV